MDIVIGVEPGIGRLRVWVNGNLNIPPGESEWVEESERSLGRIGLDFKLHNIGPHMHTIGKSLEAKLIHADGSETCLLDVPRWDFNWQFDYAFEEPITITGDDAISLTCTYDSTDRDTTTRWGDGTGDEMCLTTMFITLD